MSTTLSPNMNLPVPGVGNESGPAYAQDVNNCMSILDAHNHSIGSGVQITPSGLNINSDLTFMDNNATNLRSVRLYNQGGVLSGVSDLSCVYNNGGNLYFNDGSGNQIAITASGGIAGSPGSIANLVAPASATYTAGSKLFTWSSGSVKAAAMDNGAVTIRETNVTSARGITIASPTSLSSNYQLTLPTALPGSTQYLSCSSSGALGTVTADSIAAAMTSTGANAILVTSTANINTSSTCSSFTTSSLTPVDITNLSATLTTTGHPVELFLMSATSSSSATTGFIEVTANSQASASVCFLEGSTIVCTNSIATKATATPNFNLIPPSSFRFIYTPSAGTYTWKAQAFIAATSSGGETIVVTNTVLMARELRY